MRCFHGSPELDRTPHLPSTSRPLLTSQSLQTSGSHFERPALLLLTSARKTRGWHFLGRKIPLTPETTAFTKAWVSSIEPVLFVCFLKEGDLKRKQNLEKNASKLPSSQCRQTSIVYLKAVGFFYSLLCSHHPRGLPYEFQQ